MIYVDGLVMFYSQNDKELAMKLCDQVIARKLFRVKKMGSMRDMVGVVMKRVDPRPGPEPAREEGVGECWDDGLQGELEPVAEIGQVHEGGLPC